jgi:hypothetical protein
MTTGDRIQAIQRFGFNRRQAAFLVTVMSYSGVCLPRQYATLAGIAYGHRVNRFFERLVRRGFASACPCLHNRAFVYRVHHRALYGAIGEPQSRFRRPVPAVAVTPRLMLLDAVLEAPDVTWLASEEDKVEHFTTRAGIPLECLPRQAARAAGAAPDRLFPDALPIGVEPSGRVLVVYGATRASQEGFRPFLRRHVAFLTAPHAWTLRLVFTPDDRPLNAGWQAVIDREIGTLLGLADRTERRVEWWRLGHRYGHLSPLVASIIQPGLGVEEGEQVGERVAARPQPLWPSSRREHQRRQGSTRTLGLRAATAGPA